MNIYINKPFIDNSLAVLDAVKNGKAFPIGIANEKGSRGSGKTGNWIRVAVLIGMMKKTKIYGLRYIAGDLYKTLTKDFLNILDSWGIAYSYHQTNKEIKFGANSIIVLAGLKNQRSDKINLTGLSSEEYQYDYGIIIKDEIVEYKREESQAVDEAIRGYHKDTLFEIKTWNPTNPLSWANKHFINYLPENENKMRTVGWDSKKTWTNENMCIETFTQTNYTTNKCIDANLKRKLDALKVSDPVRARTMSYGLDGVDSGTLWINPNIKQITWNKIKNIIEQKKAMKSYNFKWKIGLDYGRGDRNAIMLVLTIPGHGFFVVDNFNYSRKTQSLITDRQIIKLAASRMKSWVEQYDLPYEIKCNFDYANYTFFEDLEREIRDQRFRFRPCKKSKLGIRVNYFRKLIDSGFFYINQSIPSNQILKEEIYYAVGKYNKDGIINLITTPCDMWDATCYSFTDEPEEYMNSILMK